MGATVPPRAATQTTALLEERSTSADPVEREDLRERAVLLNMDLADRLAARYDGRGIPLEDLQQVAYLALCKAVDRYDPATGSDFLAFAMPTVTGELRRHFRDEGWTVRPPRRIQELQPRLTHAEEELSQRLGRRASVVELAEALELPEAEVREAAARDGAFRPTSLDLPVGERGETTLGGLVPSETTSQNATEARVVLAPVVRRLSDRDRRVLGLRYYLEWTQGQIADDLGVSQVQVSRLLRRILGDLLEAMGNQAPREAAG